MERALEKSPNIWKLCKALLNGLWIKKDNGRKLENYFELNENESTTYQNLQEATIVIFRGIFIALNINIRKEESSQVND